MRRTFLLAALLLPLAGAARAQQNVSRAIHIAADASIRIWNLTGSVTVLGWDRDSLAVSGTIAGSASNLFFGGSGRTAKLGVQSPDDPTRAEPSRLVVQVPRGARVWVKTATADIDVGGLTGGADLNATSGAIRVRGSLHDLNAETMDGTITLETTADWLRAKSATGDIVFRGGGEDVAATTVGGHLQITSSGLRRARFESITGDIDLAGALARDASLDLASHSGKISLAVPPGFGAEYNLSSYDGEITTGLVDRAPVAQPGAGSRTLDFVAHGGGAIITIRTFKGAIRVIER